jgi:hypothetical protein
VVWEPGAWLLVWDLLDGDGDHRLDLHWHLGGEPTWLDKTSLRVECGQHMAGIALEGGNVSQHRGERDAELGWLSPHYGSLQPIPTIRVRHEGRLPHEFITRIRLKPGSEGNDQMEEALAWLRQQHGQL